MQVRMSFAIRLRYAWSRPSTVRQDDDHDEQQRSCLYTLNLPAKWLSHTAGGSSAGLDQLAGGTSKPA